MVCRFLHGLHFSHGLLGFAWFWLILLRIRRQWLRVFSFGLVSAFRYEVFRLVWRLLFVAYLASLYLLLLDLACLCQLLLASARFGLLLLAFAPTFLSRFPFLAFQVVGYGKRGQRLSVGCRPTGNKGEGFWEGRWGSFAVFLVVRNRCF